MSVFTERRSIRKYDPNFKIPRAELETILNETFRAPSSMNMQPTRFVIVESAEYKEKLRPVLYGNQTQLDTSSAMICIFTDLYKYNYAEQIYNTAYDKGLMPLEVRDRQIRNINNMTEDLDLKQVEKTGVLDGGLISMQLMLVAKAHGYGTCPIGGFRHDKLANALDIDPERFKPLLIVSIGKPDEDGWDSVRLPLDQTVSYK